MSTPDVRVEFNDSLPPGTYVVPVEAEGVLCWHIRRNAMREDAITEAEAILRHLAEHGHWRQSWDQERAATADELAQAAARPPVLRMEPHADLPHGRALVLLEAAGELIWYYRPGAMHEEFGNQAGRALGYLVRQGAWAQHWEPDRQAS